MLLSKALIGFSINDKSRLVVLVYLISLCRKHGFLGQQNDKSSLYTFPCSIGKTTIVLTYLINLCVEHMDSSINKMINSIYILFLVILQKLL